MQRNKPRVTNIINLIGGKNAPALSKKELYKLVRLILYGKNIKRHNTTVDGPLSEHELHKLLTYLVPYAVYNLTPSELAEHIEADRQTPPVDSHSGYIKGGERGSGNAKDGGSHMDGEQSVDDILSELAMESEERTEPD